VKVLTILFLATTVAAGSPQGNSQGRGRGSQPAQESNTVATGSKVSSNAFAEMDVKIIRDWFSKSANLQGLPPGLAKRESLPPGLEKQLQKNGTLPPGLQQKIQPLPPVLEVQLTKLPEGQKRVAIAGSIILMNSKTSVIIDILTKVF
jgi:hypothetical protein